MAFLTRNKRKATPPSATEEASANNRPLEIDATAAAGPDPDDELDSDAGFEVGVDKIRKSGILGWFQRPDREFRVEAVNKSATMDTIVRKCATGDSDGMTDEDEEEGSSHSNPEPKTDNDSRRKKMIALAFCCFCLLALALFFGLFFGLQDNEGSIVTAGEETESSAVYINVLIEMDDNPEEISWSIARQSNWTVVAEVPKGAYTSQMSPFINDEVAVEWDKAYVFRIVDSGGDGLSAGGQGRWLLVYKDEEFVSGVGDFGIADVVAFSMSSDEGRAIITEWNPGL